MGYKHFGHNITNKIITDSQDNLQLYELPNTNVQLETDSSHEYELEPMCVNECEGAIAALTDATATVSVKFYDEQGEQVSLSCNA